MQTATLTMSFLKDQYKQLKIFNRKQFGEMKNIM